MPNDHDLDVTAAPDSGGGRSLTPRYAILAVGVSLIIILADQITKYWALESLNFGEPVKVLGEALQWVLALNPGAAFSFLSEATWLFTIISSLVVILIAVSLIKVQSTVWGIVAGLVLGGAIGNLIDRFFREPGFAIGHVVDFIYTPWMMPAIYNVADMAVVVGMILFFLLTVFGVAFDGRRHPKPSPEEPKEVSSNE